MGSSLSPSGCPPSVRSVGMGVVSPFLWTANLCLMMVSFNCFISAKDLHQQTFAAWHTPSSQDIQRPRQLRSEIAQLPPVIANGQDLPPFLTGVLHILPCVDHVLLMQHFADETAVMHMALERIRSSGGFICIYAC